MKEKKINVLVKKMSIRRFALVLERFVVFLNRVKRLLVSVETGESCIP